MKKIFLLLAAAAAAVLAGCKGRPSQPGFPASRDREAPPPESLPYEHDDYDSWQKVLEENTISEEFQAGLEDFAFQSGSLVLKDARQNSTFSPLSLYYALGLAGCGATGETADEILSVLGAENRQELARQCGRLYRWYAYQEQRTRKEYQEYGTGEFDGRIHLADSLWMSDSLGMKEDYQTLAAENFFASTYHVDFKSAEAGERIGAWISQNTNSVLTPELTFDTETLLAIVNTLYYYGAWQNPFSETATEPAIFTLEDGSEITCPFMNRTEAMGQVWRGDGYTRAGLYASSHSQMVFVLPDEGISVSKFLESPQRLKEAFTGPKEEPASAEIIWKVPKFSFGSSFPLRESLNAMGISRMFQEDAGFQGISDQKLWVSQVLQETHIGVDEEGVEGAAYTMIALAGAGMPLENMQVEMALDRPFLFGIQDTSNDVWLFLGICQNPAEGD